MEMNKIIICAMVALSCAGCRSTEKNMQSPAGNIMASITTGAAGLNYKVGYMGNDVIGCSPLGIVVDGGTIGPKATIRGITTEEIDESYATRGFHPVASNHCNEYTLDLADGEQTFKMQFRLYNDGVAFRYIIPVEDGCKKRTVNGELTTFGVSAGLPVWFFERPNDWKLKTYAGEWMQTTSDSLYNISPNGPVQGPVLVYELGEGRHMAITEAALYNYSGMRLSSAADASLQVNFTESEGFEIEGDITTPWRVIMLTENLNELVNSDIITNLNPAPDESLFGDTAWIKPGRSVWSWWSEKTGYMTPEYEQQYIDMAAELGYEYTTIDEGWEKDWTDKWGQLKEMCDYARSKGVGVLVWKRSGTMSDPANDYAMMGAFMDSVAAAGACGIKIDFMDSESKKTIDFDIAALRLAAQRHLMINFHGCQKPSGEIRTYPNEITREGIRGLELNKMNQHLTADHNVALIFTRGILNNNDYTPVGFSNPGNTTRTHQLAMAYALTSPLTTIAEDPEMLLNDRTLKDILPFIKELPTDWDETRVLQGSSIDGVAIMARRKGDTWYLIAVNGSRPRKVNVALDFLGHGKWEIATVEDTDEMSASSHRNFNVDNEMVIEMDLGRGGGFVGRISDHQVLQ